MADDKPMTSEMNKATDIRGDWALYDQEYDREEGVHAAEGVANGFMLVIPVWVVGGAVGRMVYTHRITFWPCALALIALAVFTAVAVWRGDE